MLVGGSKPFYWTADHATQLQSAVIDHITQLQGHRIDDDTQLRSWVT